MRVWRPLNDIFNIIHILKKCYLLLQYLVTDDKILNIKSEFNGISVKNSIWLQSLVTDTSQNNSEIFQGKRYTILFNTRHSLFQKVLMFLKIYFYTVSSCYNNILNKIYKKLFIIERLVF